ncbi:hypothetical protein [Geodermatophilus sp. DSM 44513]|uniref:hypothetical protein n=1 Tax=Geodermatophilus sp. DSM 44513 TaxID=1528104 RepID=UPI0028F6E77D|nr:hypothetical protein [Geodermatophilus sp. DSM 44513]WNV74585.1 hypothetical protein RTG05_16545 [Geodermatophilus sp. DSM 44513]
MPTPPSRLHALSRALSRGRAGASPAGRRGAVVVAVALLVVLTAALAGIVLGADGAGEDAAPGAQPTADAPAAPDGRPAASGPAGDGGPPPPAPVPVPADAPPPDGTAAAELLRWADRELPAGTRLRPTDGARDDLLAAGATGALLGEEGPTGPGDLVLTVTDGDPPPGGRVVTTVDGLTLVDPAPGTPTPEQLDVREALAQAVLANPTTRTTPEAAAVLRSADVDMRLLSLLAVLTARDGIGVAALSRAGGGGGPARSALITWVGGAPVGAGQPATGQLQTWLDAQLPPFAPDHVEVTADGVRVSHRYASDPDALVADASS